MTARVARNFRNMHVTPRKSLRSSHPGKGVQQSIMNEQPALPLIPCIHASQPRDAQFSRLQSRPRFPSGRRNYPIRRHASRRSVRVLLRSQDVRQDDVGDCGHRDGRDHFEGRGRP